MKGNLIAEKGDNATTLSKYLSVDKGRANEILRNNDASNLKVGDKITSSEIKAVTKEITTEIANTNKLVQANNKETTSLQKENGKLSSDNKELKNEVKINGTLMKSEPGDPKGGNAMAFTILNVVAENKISNNNKEIKSNNQAIQKNTVENKTAQQNLTKTLDKYNVD